MSGIEVGPLVGEHDPALAGAEATQKRSGDDDPPRPPGDRKGARIGLVDDDEVSAPGQSAEGAVGGDGRPRLAERDECHRRGAGAGCHERNGSQTRLDRRVFPQARVRPVADLGEPGGLADQRGGEQEENRQAGERADDRAGAEQPGRVAGRQAPRKPGADQAENSRDENGREDRHDAHRGAEPSGRPSSSSSASISSSSVERVPTNRARTAPRSSPASSSSRIRAAAIPGSSRIGV